MSAKFILYSSIMYLAIIIGKTNLPIGSLDSNSTTIIFHRISTKINQSLAMNIQEWLEKITNVLERKICCEIFILPVSIMCLTFIIDFTYKRSTKSLKTHQMS